MPTVDRREPAVYVTVEDVSYVAPTIEVGRVGYIVVLCDRGPHNRIVTVTSQKQFHEMFGKPDRRRVSQSFYIADKFLEYSNKLLVVRVMPDANNLESAPPSHLSFWANKVVRSNLPYLLPGIYTFTQGSNVVEAADENSWQAVRIGDHIFKASDQPTYAKRVVGKDDNGWQIFLEAEYEGSTQSNTTGARIVTPPVMTTGVYNWQSGSREVECQNQQAFEEISVGDWIYKNGDNLDLARQVVSKTVDNGVHKLVLDQPYTTSGNGIPAVRWTPYVSVAMESLDDEDEMPATAQDVVYYFYAVGAGSFYNDIVIKGVRNTELEKMYVDDDGNPKYPYMFMDIAVYAIGADGNQKLLEGPWSVSLIQRNPENVVVRDIYSGNTLYIEDVINQNSNYVRCRAGMGVEELITGTDAQDKRLQVMLELSDVGVLGLNNVAKGGINLDNGTDGNLYDSSGNLNEADSQIMSLVARAYDGSLVSVDGSVEQIQEYIYPWFEPDYIICGGFPPEVQVSAKNIAELRQDCIVLGDTGGIKVKVDQDLKARRDDVPWNTWNAMLYVQYRQIYDKYTGKHIWITPVYHAVQRHLYCDGAYFIGEPVAGIEKGSIDEPVKLSYIPNHTERGDLMDKELNFTIYEPQGTYFLVQFTTWKRLSILKRAHVAKFVAYCRKVIPMLLKDILQRKATQFWINQAKYRVDTFLSYFLENPAIERYSILKSYTTSVKFDDVRSELLVYITIQPIRAIERINVFITVQ